MTAAEIMERIWAEGTKLLAQGKTPTTVRLGHLEVETLEAEQGRLGDTLYAEMSELDEQGFRAIGQPGPGGRTVRKPLRVDRVPERTCIQVTATAPAN
jgi:hypothetical protein